ncbi:TetR/AcrR family transcriptional regulator [Kitasatospora sp. NBC_01287]|uniref:TetR/AcrR family transcriptional regulator n=1 Tax=Kitasatospora sp. NBC_01287 TaxID=2903573 RepID=UPI00225272E4|nr:TetR/AcrR family transcriptional regulator [Kitasatospora sp. NBC_01287]MCX4747583.1 TetR/AcrR family transcriptional regulator [Kitasatospora sp. NBC_01287]
MPTQPRRERDRAERHSLILRAARELAETEGWDAVTTRRLAERIEYSQPVLYTHFANKGAIMDAVALEGFGELAAVLERAPAGLAAPADRLFAAARAYLDYAGANPALYEAMFSLGTSLSFGTEESPAELKRAFGAFLAVAAPLAGGAGAETFVEVVWSALHGQVLLARGGRLRPGLERERLAVLIGGLLAGGAPLPD